jgi:hypothetical protein
MPFTPEPNLPPDPAVKVFFSGLMILKPSADEKSCEVFVNNSAPRHHLTIEVRRKRAGSPDEIMMRHVGPLAFAETLTDDPEEQLVHGFFIKKVSGGPKGVRRYAPAAAPPDGEPDGLDLAVNMAGAQLHGGNPDLDPDPVTNKSRKLLDIDPLGGRPSIHINDGAFYTAAKTRKEINITLKKDGAEDKPLEPFASLIAANIYLGSNEESVTVKWRNQGKLEALSLAKPAPGVSYEIYIVNDPLYESDSEEEPAHDEFREYYKILPNVETSRQFRLKVDVPPNATERGTTKAPCMAVILDGGV